MPRHHLQQVFTIYNPNIFSHVVIPYLNIFYQKEKNHIILSGLELDSCRTTFFFFFAMQELIQRFSVEIRGRERHLYLAPRETG